jgi:streptomycin 6-kinase
VINDLFDVWLRRWRLVPDGAPILTHSSRLLPVISDGLPAILKIALEQEEIRGAALMAWYAGQGAARVLAHDGSALLLERAVGNRSLKTMARMGEDDAASRIICETVDQLHAPRKHAPGSELIPLSIWFRELEPAASRYGGVLYEAAVAARGLLAAPREERPLHGDIHHDNVLDGAERGWLAVDPNGLFGERSFDYANTLCNPDFETATSPGRLRRQAELIAMLSRVDLARLLQWTLAYAGLSASWTLNDGGQPTTAISVAKIAAAECANT